MNFMRGSDCHALEKFEFKKRNVKQVTEVYFPQISEQDAFDSRYHSVNAVQSDKKEPVFLSRIPAKGEKSTSDTQRLLVEKWSWPSGLLQVPRFSKETQKTSRPAIQHQIMSSLRVNQATDMTMESKPLVMAVQEMSGV